MAVTTVSLHLRLLILGAVFVFFTNTDAKEHKDPLALAYKTLSTEEEKTDFLKYFLALGLQDWASAQPRPPKFFTLNTPDSFSKTLSIPPESVEKFENLNIPRESRKKLLEWTKAEFNLSTKNVVELVKREKSNGRGFFPDIGALCCPW